MTKGVYQSHERLGFMAMGGTGGNPPVSAVLANEQGEVVCRAHTQHFGGNHAERELYQIWKSTQNSFAKRAERFKLSVSLEPCTHKGKTPPCRELVLAEAPSELRIGFRDPNPLVSSQEDEIYYKNGIQVVMDPMLAKVSYPFLFGFLKRMQTKKPWVLFKTATSQEGNYATSDKKPKPISGMDQMPYLQVLRAKMDAIAVGPQTTYIDEPKLNYRVPNTNSFSSDSLPAFPSSGRFFDVGVGLLNQLFLAGKDFVGEYPALEYQPIRVFCLDTKRLPSRSFWEVQKELLKAYGRPLALFWTLERGKQPALPEEIQKTILSLSLSPVQSFSLRDGNRFLEWLTDFGINTLLCEVGSFFPNFLKEHLTEEDQVLEVRNESLQLPGGIPFVWKDNPILSESKIGSHRWILRHWRQE